MEKFYFFNSFLDTARAIPDDEMRLKYLMAVAEYWIEWKESDDPMIKALMTQTKFTIDRSKEISDMKSEKMKGNQNARKNWEKQWKQRKTEKTDKNSEKQKKQEEEVEVEEEYKKEVEEKKQPQPPQPQKNKYGECTRLSESEYNKLVTRYGEKMVHRYITQLDYYITEKGKEYKSHYLTLLKRMTKDEVPEKKEIPKTEDYQIEDGVYDLEKLLNQSW